MKKIAIIGANGKQGLCLTDEAVSRGFDVTAVIRQAECKNAKAKVLQKDLFDLTADDLKKFDIVISAFGAWTKETIPQHVSSVRHLCDCLKGTKINCRRSRLFVCRRSAYNYSRRYSGFSAGF